MKKVKLIVLPADHVRIQIQDFQPVSHNVHVPQDILGQTQVYHWIWVVCARPVLSGTSAHNLQVRVAQVANQYLHDYSNEEICVDTSMCFAALLGTAPSKVFTRIWYYRESTYIIYNYIQNWCTLYKSIYIFLLLVHIFKRRKYCLILFSRFMLLRVYLVH